MKFTDFAEVVKIEKGWSHEQKYKVTNADGESFLLRITPIEQYEYKKAEFENMQMISEMGIPMCQPIEFGTFDEGVYSLQSWIDGVDAEEVVKTLSDEEVYKYGYEAGVILKKIHSIEAPEGVGEWESFFNKKMNRKIENYQKCPLKCEDSWDETYDLIYSIAVLHMLVLEEDRNKFLTFVRKHLKEDGYGLILSMGDGEMEHSSDIYNAFDKQERVHVETGTKVCIASTSCKIVSFTNLEREIERNGLSIVEKGITSIELGFPVIMYVLVKKK